MSEGEGRPEVNGAAQETAGEDVTLTVTRPPVMLGYPRVPCRIRGCRRTIPYSPGFLPDKTCWRHHHLVTPVYDDRPPVEAWARRVDEVLVGAEGRWAA